MSTTTDKIQAETRFKPFVLKTIATLLLSMASISATAGIAAETHPLEDIREAARQYADSRFAESPLEGNVDTEIEVGYLDNRLKLRKCESPLQAVPLSQRSQNSNFTVTVKCVGDKPWSVYVPVKVLTYVEVKVAARPLIRGVDIAEGDTVTEKREVSRLRSGYFNASDKLVGRIPKRALSRGAVISPTDLTTHKVIRRGGKVSILAKTGGVVVRMPGIAMSDGSEGEVIKVENQRSKRVIDAIAIKPGVVEVPM